MSEPTIDAIRRAIADRRTWAIETLSEWVRFDSVLGREAPAQQWAAGVFEQLGLEVRLEEVDVDAIRDLPGFSPVDWDYGGRPNLVGVHRARRQEGRSLIFNGHVDVVSPEPSALWSSPPFEPLLLEQEDGAWLRGRGAADMKGGSVCHLWALAALRDLGFVPAADVIVQSPIEEECTGNGTLALCAAGYRADACIIPEPFDETILLEQIGVLWFRIRVLGKTTHVLGASRGINAIEKSWLLMRAMRELEEELNAPEAIPPSYRDVEHPINLNIGVIEGGDWPSTVPGECLVRYRLGLFGEQSCADLMARVEQRVRAVADTDPWLRENPPRVEWMGFRAEGCRLDPDDALVRTLAAAHQALRGEAPKHLRATCTTDTRFFLLHYGIPATCYGPVGRAFHAADERVSIDSMERVATVMAELVRRWCGLIPEMHT